MKSWFLIVMLWLPLSSWAAIDTYEFKDEATRERFTSLVAELRCPKCQNQNLADSNSPIAKDLRNEVYRMLQQGLPDGEIKDFMVARYGEFVLYRPRVQESTYVLWYGPFVLLAFGLVVILLLVKRRSRRVDVVSAAEEPAASELESESELTADQRAKLDQLLRQDKSE